MSHSRIFDEYAKIMAAKDLIKTADKKDPDYNVIPDKAGPDTQVEETGWELTEIAHPEQIQVAESRLNDGIVENGVERQKVMIDVALRNPRGVIANLMNTLVKAANILDAEMSEESLKMSAEVDELLKKLAQQDFYSADAEFEAIKSAMEGVVDTFPNLNYGFFGMGGKDTKAALDKFTSEVRRWTNMAKTIPAGQKKAWTQQAAAFVRANEKRITEQLASAKDDVAFFGTSHKDAATRAWNDLVATASGVAPLGETPTTQAPAVTEERKPYIPPTIPKEQQGVPSKAPGRHYSVKSPQVHELQSLLGVDQDSKFGPLTFGALKQKATENSLLNDLLKSKPKTYEDWTNSDVGEAIERIHQGAASAEKAREQAAAPKK